ncbi:MAG: hypothetical protein PT977_13275 [Acidobacteriota bacterium]|nr:hypothetical protein [Acidobacteriota bacterium]
MKSVSLVLTIGLGSGLLLAGCNKAPSGAADATGAPGRPAARARRGKVDVAALLTKEEVGAILGEPVTEVEASGSQSVTYKTAVLQLETSLEVEQMGDVADAVQSMEGARKATGFLGGKPEDVPGLGDEAIFGAMSTLYFRKGDTFIHIQPPNLQMIAGLKAAEKLRKAPLGSDEQMKAMEELQAVQKTDPMSAGLQGGDAMQGALATIKASSKKQGTQYETDSRAMAVALARKLLEKL